MKILTNFDPTGYKQKPVGGLAGTVQENLGDKKNAREVSIKELAELLSNGHAVRASYCTGKTDDTFEFQQWFLFDFDNDDKDIQRGEASKIPGAGYVTIESLLERAEKYGVPIGFAHHTYSHNTVEKNNVDRIRLVLCMDKPIVDKRERWLVYQSLSTIFPEGDLSCKNLSRFFYGTCHQYVPVKMDRELANIQDLVMSAYTVIKETSKPNKLTEKVEEFCGLVHVNMVNGMPDVREKISLKNLKCKKGENTAIPIIYNIENAVISPKNNIGFTVPEEDWKQGVKVASRGKNEGTEVLDKASRTKVLKTKEAKVIDRTTNFELIQENCKLLHEFMNGTHWATHEEIKGMAIAMTKIEGGAEKMIKVIEANPHFYKDQYNKRNTISKMNGYNYTNQACDGFCPHCKSCPKRGYDMYSVLEVGKKNCVLLSNQRAKTSLKEIQDFNTKVVSDFLTGPDDNSITVLKSYVGTGKSYSTRDALILNPAYATDLVLASNTHNLSQEQADSLASHFPNLVHIAKPIFYRKSIITNVETLQKQGLYYDAFKAIKEELEFLDGLDQSALTDKIKESQCSLKAYIKAIEEVKTTHELILCTHARLVHLENHNTKKYIIDEDVVNTVVNTIEITEKVEYELNRMIDKAKALKMAVEASQMTSIIELIEKARQKPMEVVEADTGSKTIEKKNYNKLIREVRPSFNIYDLLNARAGRNNRTNSSTKDSISLYNINDIPNKKVLVLSATANEEVYKALFKDRQVKFYDSGLPEPDKPHGEIVMHYMKDLTSKSALSDTKKLKKVIDKMQDEAPRVTNIISHSFLTASLKKYGYNQEMYFGKCSGTNSLAGKDLIVLGTPHQNPNSYALLAHACGIKGNLTNPEEGVVTRNGFEFTMQLINATDITSEGALLREIQAYKIESELVQAVGRARTLRNNCTVHLFSSYPIEGSTLY